MGYSFISLIALVAVLAAAPWLARKLRQKFLIRSIADTDAVRLISVLAVGPQQRIATVEIGSRYGATVLVLGVTGQSINCLHVMPQATGTSTTGEAVRSSFSQELDRSVHGQ